MPVIGDVFSQQAAASTQYADTIDWTVRCGWLQVASSHIILYTHKTMLMRSARLVVQVLQDCLQVLSQLRTGLKRFQLTVNTAEYCGACGY